MKRFRNNHIGRWLLPLALIVTLCSVTAFASGERRADEEVRPWADTKIPVCFVITPGTPAEILYDGQPHEPSLTAYIRNGPGDDLGEKLDWEQGVDFNVYYMYDTIGQELAEGEKPVNAGAYSVEGEPIDSAYEWDGIAVNFQITAIPVDYTITELLHTYVNHPQGPYEASVEFETETPLVKDVDYRVQYYRYRNGALESSPVNQVDADGEYEVSVSMMSTTEAHPINYQLGVQTPAKAIMVVKEKEYAATFYYNNRDAEQPQEPFAVYKKAGEMLTSEEAPAPNVPPNMKFGGWYLDQDGDHKFSKGDLDFNQLLMGETDIGIVANWVFSDDATLRSLTLTGPDGNPLPLCASNYTSARPFDPAVEQYYVRVGTDVSSVHLSVEPAMSGAAVQLGKGTRPSTEQDFDLAPAVDGSANELTIRLTAPDGLTKKTYTVAVQRLVIPSITLSYGNSPYGMIMASTGSAEDQEAAKREFDETLIYDGVREGMRYGEEAWSSEAYRNYNKTGQSYNGDRDETAIFVYQKQAFRDPGFTAINSLGLQVDPGLVSRTMKVTSIPAGVADFKKPGTEMPVIVRNSDAQYRFTELDAVVVRPGVYEMTYSFQDGLTGETVSAIRRVVYVAQVGDVYLDGVVDDKDVSAVEQNLYLLNTTDSLYRYRVADACADDNGVININDAGKIERRVLDPDSFPKYYRELS